MVVFGMSLVLGLFVALLFVNFYFRWKVIKVYHYLTDRKIEFNAEHIFNRRRLKEEILPRYPESQQEIMSFVNYIHFSVKMASALLFLVTVFGLILMHYR
jgi:hypothetical protein